MFLACIIIIIPGRVVLCGVAKIRLQLAKCNCMCVLWLALSTGSKQCGVKKMPPNHQKAITY